MGMYGFAFCTCTTPTTYQQLPQHHNTPIITQDATTAKKLAYSKEVATRCITLEGDDFNPTGLLTGGSRNRGPPLLARLATLQELEGSIAQHQEEVSKAQRALDAMSAAGKQYTKYVGGG